MCRYAFVTSNKSPEDSMIVLHNVQGVRAVAQIVKREDVSHHNAYWYALNHNDKPNLKPTIVYKKGQFYTIAFAAIQVFVC